MARKVSSQRSPTSSSELLLDLQRLGFSEYEARTYVSLLSGEPATAYEVSKNSGLPRANTYGALESLTKKEAVQPISENPVRYAPVDPDMLLSRFEREFTGLRDRLKVGLANVTVTSPSEIVWTVNGQRDLDDKINELINGARDHVWIKASSDVLRAHVGPLKEAAARGAALLLIVFGSDPQEFRFGRNCRVYLHEASGVRIGGADNLFTITIDYAVALTASLSGEVVGAYTSSEPVVRMAETLIRHDYYMAEILTYFGDEIEKRFGKYLIELRRQTFSADQIRQLESNLAQLAAKTMDALPATAHGAARPLALEGRRARRGQP